MVEEIEGIAFFINENRCDTPGHIHLAAHIFMHGTTDDITIWAVAGQHAGGLSGFGYRYNGFGVYIMSSCYGCMGNRICNIWIGFVLQMEKAFFVVNICLGTDGDSHHCLQCF